MEIADQIRYSIVIPLYNEEDNIRPLYSRIVSTMAELDGNYEIVFVDDGSRDQTFKILSEISDTDSRVTVVRLRKNFGQTAGLQAGFDFARGEIIISMDGDLQHAQPHADLDTGPAALARSAGLADGDRDRGVRHRAARSTPARRAVQ